MGKGCDASKLRITDAGRGQRDRPQLIARKLSFAAERVHPCCDAFFARARRWYFRRGAGSRHPRVYEIDLAIRHCRVESIDSHAGYAAIAQIKADQVFECGKPG